MDRKGGIESGAINNYVNKNNTKYILCHTPLAKKSLDEIFDFTAEVYQVSVPGTHIQIVQTVIPGTK